MRGHGLAQRLKDLNLESGVETTGAAASNSKRPKSPTKSPSKRPAAAAKPYDLPSASGPGGLVTMLKSLRQIRGCTKNEDQTMETDDDVLSRNIFSSTPNLGRKIERNNNRGEMSSPPLTDINE